MKKMSIRLAALVLPLVVSSVSLAGQTIGDNATLLVPVGVVTNARQVLVIKGAPKPTATKVGNCGDDLKFQDADLVDRPDPPGGRGAKIIPPIPTVKTQVAVVIPGVTGFTEMKVGWQMGTLGDKGVCGPGYDIKYSNLIATQ